MHCDQDVIKNKILDIIKTILEEKDVKIVPFQKVKDLNIDSLDMFEILMEIEDACEIEIDADAIMEFETVDDIIQYCQRVKERRKDENKN